MHNKTSFGIWIVMGLLLIGIATGDDSITLSSTGTNQTLTGLSLSSPWSDLGSQQLLNLGSTLSLPSVSSLGGSSTQLSLPSVAGLGPKIDNVEHFYVDTPPVSGFEYNGVWYGIDPNNDQLQVVTVKGSPATKPGDTAKVDQQAPQVTGTQASLPPPSNNFKSFFKDINKAGAPAATGWNWALRAIAPSWYHDFMLNYATNLRVWPTTVDAYCSLTRPHNANQNTMLGYTAGKMPSLQLQAWRSDAIVYNTSGQPSPLYYTKVTFRYENILDPLAMGEDLGYKLNLTGYDYNGTPWTFDLSPGEHDVLLEVNTGSLSVGGSDAVMGYWPVKLKQVCLIFIDENHVINPLFLKRLQEHDRFCTEVVEVVDKTGGLKYEIPTAPSVSSPSTGHVLSQ